MVFQLAIVQLLSIDQMLFPNVTCFYPRYMMATKALITKANGLAMLVALLLLLGGGEAELSGAPEVAAAVPVTGTEVVTVLVLDNVARLNVLLREMGVRVPVPRAPVPTAAVVTLPGMTVVTTRRWLLLLLLLGE